QVVGDTILMTPTNSCLGRLHPTRLSVLDLDGNHLDGPPPSKEVVLHLALYATQPEARAVAHVHSTHAVAWSCLDDLDLDDVLPPLTAYYVMRVGRLPMIGYLPPGDPGLGDAVVAARSRCTLLAHHGSVAAAPTLEAAVDAVEEIEETARIALLLRGHPHHHLSPRQISGRSR
ncbi:MAG: class II aldolase/adducin family protein, partial [Actinomycetota bacterium]|nr:class II aldolase/adducin family protein [Actinomycetota bacterium]